MRFQKSTYQYFILILIFFSGLASAQYLDIQQNYTEEQLVKDVFLGASNSGCFTVSNIQFSGGAFGNSQKSYAYFDGNGTSFPLTEGLILSTGNASSAKGPNSYILSETAPGWSGDSDLEDALHISNTFDATVLEFDFISNITDKISFDYIFSSEQYLTNPGTYQCDYTDGFAFLIKEAGTTRYDNIALVPGTSLPVSVATIRGKSINRNCSAVNEHFFGGFNDFEHPTNFNGQTVVLKAEKNIIPGVKYHIKLVIADQGNYLYDSAVFLSAKSFSATKYLGPDRTVAAGNPLCPGSSLLLNAAIPGATYQWMKDGVAVNGATDPTFSVTEAGHYSVEIGVSGCVAKGEILVEYFDPSLSSSEFVRCDSDLDGTVAVDLNQITNGLLPGYSGLDIKYYLNEADAIAGNSNFLPTKWEYTSDTTVYVRIKHPVCDAVVNEVIFKAGNKVPVSKKEISSDVCDTDLDGISSTDLSAYITDFTADAGVDFKFYESQSNANQNTGVINPKVNFSGTKTYFARLEKAGLCPETVKITLTAKASEKSASLADTTVCENGNTVLDAGPGYDSYLWKTGETSSSISATEGEYYVDLEKNGCVYRQHVSVSTAAKPIITNVDVSGSTVTVFATGGSGGLLYSINGSDFQPSPVFLNVERGSYKAYVKDNCSVITENFVIINLIKVITPNGDGYNDEMNYEDLSIKNDVMIKVFDRYGNQVFASAPNILKWDGKNFGKPVPTGTYWYIITWTEPATSEIKNYHGWVVVKNRN